MNAIKTINTSFLVNSWLIESKDFFHLILVYLYFT